MNRKIIRVIIFYILFVLMCVIAESVAPSVHGPGLSFLFFIILGCISILMFMYDLGKFINGNKDYKINVITQATLFLLFIFLIFYLK